MQASLLLANKTGSVLKLQAGKVWFVSRSSLGRTISPTWMFSSA